MTERQGYRRDIDGLRSVAVLSVVAYHFGLGLPGGFTGVDIFFVISGFLIGSHIYDEVRQGSFNYKRFYYKRAKRILPALIAVVIFTGVMMALVGSPTELRNFGRDAVAAIFSFSNVTLYRSLDYFRPSAEGNPLLMTWSLGVEEQFYIAAPVVLALTVRLRESRRLLAITVLALLSLLLAVWQMRHNTQAAFYLLPPRVWELAAGVMLAIWRAHHNVPANRRFPAATELLAVIGLALLVVPIVVFDKATPFPGLGALPSVVGAVLLLNTERSFVNRRILSNAVATFFGLISYSLYLWHWPLISMSNMVMETEPSLATRLALLGLSIALAYGSYRWIETPFRQSRTPDGVSLRRYASVMMLVAGVAGSIYVARGFPQRWPETFLAKEAVADAPQSQCLAPYGVADPVRPANCAPGNYAKAIALVGDSHAGAMGPAIQTIADSAGVGFHEMTKASCPFLLEVSRAMQKYPRHADECRRFNEQVMNALIADPKVRVVVVGGFWRVGLTEDGTYVSTAGRTSIPADLLYNGLSGSVQRLLKAGKQVVLLGDVPFFHFTPIKRAASCANSVRATVNGVEPNTRACEFGRLNPSAEDTDAERIVSRVATESGAVYFDPRQGFCDAQGCRFSNSEQMLYIDQQHLSKAGGIYIAKFLTRIVVERL